MNDDNLRRERLDLITDPRYCAHPDAVSVESALTGETVAALCPTCDADLPAAWLTCAHQETIDISSLGERRGRTLCNGCGATYWSGDTQAQADPPEPTEDEWAVGDRVTVLPVTAQGNNGPPQTGYLVFRDPDGDARISTVEYGDEPKPEPEFAITLYQEPDATGCR